MGFMHHSMTIGIIQLDRDIIKNLKANDVKKLITSADNWFVKVAKEESFLWRNQL